MKSISMKCMKWHRSGWEERTGAIQWRAVLLLPPRQPGRPNTGCSVLIADEGKPKSYVAWCSATRVMRSGSGGLWWSQKSPRQCSRHAATASGSVGQPGVIALCSLIWSPGLSRQPALQIRTGQVATDGTSLSTRRECTDGWMKAIKRESLESSGTSEANDSC